MTVPALERDSTEEGKNLLRDFKMKQKVKVSSLATSRSISMPDIIFFRFRDRGMGRLARYESR